MNIDDIIRLLKNLDEKPGSFVKQESALYPVTQATHTYHINHLATEESILKNAIKVKHAQVTDDVYAIVSIAHENDVYKSLLLYLDGTKVISKESTTLIMKNKFKEMGLSYSIYNQATKSIFGGSSSYKLPYIHKQRIYMPVNAVIKTSGTWVALHHVTAYSQDSQYDCTKLQFINKVNLITDLTKQSFEKQLERSLKILAVQDKVIGKFNLDLGDVSIKLSRDNKELLVHRMLDQHKDMVEDVNYMEYYYRMMILQFVDNEPEVARDFIKQLLPEHIVEK